MKENTQENKSVKEVKEAKEVTEEIATVPYIVYEAEQARTERREKRLIIALIIAIIIIFVSNMVWLFAWCQYDYSDTSTVTLDSGESGNAYYIGNDGDINNGKDYSNKDTIKDEGQEEQGS